MKVDIVHKGRNYSGDITEIRFSNKNITNIDELRFTITAVCYAYSFSPCIYDDEWGFETWFNSIDPKGAYKRYKIICGYQYQTGNKTEYICDWY